MELDVDNVMEVNFPEATVSDISGEVEVVFKDGTKRIYEGEEYPEAVAILKHWTPPTA